MKTVDRAADLGERMKKALVRTADQAQNLTDDGQVTPSEYAGDKLQYGMEDIASEAGHIVVDTGKGAYRTGKSAIQKFREKRRAEAEQRRQCPYLHPSSQHIRGRQAGWPRRMRK